jgi:hypothetical protein
MNEQENSRQKPDNGRLGNNFGLRGWKQVG